MLHLRRKSWLTKVVFLLVLCWLATGSALAQIDWPRDVELPSGTLTVYQPQMDNLEGDFLYFRSAMSYKVGDGEPTFGAAWFKSRVEIDRGARMVHLVDLKVTDTRFPEEAGDVESQMQAVINENIGNWNLDFSLDALLTSLEASEEEIAATKNLKMEPPEIIYRDHPAVLVMIDGDPVEQEIENSPYTAVVNTPYPIIHDPKKNTFYLSAGTDVWFTARSATGPYSFAASVPSDIDQMMQVDDQDPPSDVKITADNAPEIVVSTVPAELLVSEGQAEFEPLVDDLLVISNSQSDIFMHVSAQQYYVVLSGRWFRSGSLSGHWDYVASDELPPAFANIPEESDQADSRVYVAGTDEAREAVMDAQIPQTAAVERGRVDKTVQYDGDPSFVGVEGTDLQYAENTASTVIKSGSKFYLVEDAVWYVSSRATGPWEVADERPEGVESIDPESPVYNVKYVYIYETTPEVVYVGYTPGYTGSYVYNTTVVYGTGWYYRPWISPYYYYPRYPTWGFHINYNPWTGWNFGISWGYGPFRIGFNTGGYWHHHHRWYGGYSRWGPGGYHHRNTNININTGDINIGNDINIGSRDRNLYRDKDQLADVKKTRDTRLNDNQRAQLSDRAGNIDRSAVADRAGNVDRDAVADRASNVDRSAAADRAGNVSADDLRNKAANRDNNVFADRDGNVYRNQGGDNWQKRDQGGWQDTSVPSSRDQTTRDRSGQQRSPSSTRQNEAYQRPSSGYNRSSGVQRQDHSRQRTQQRTQQYNRQHQSRSRRR